MATVRDIVRQIHDRFGPQIERATRGNLVSPALLAGLTFNESGRDRAGQINPRASRFEKHVHAALKAVKDGTRRAYGRVTRADIWDASDAALRALATSHGVTQIMGYHVIHAMTDPDGSAVTVAELADTERHYAYAVQLMMADGLADLREYERATKNGDPRARKRAIERLYRRWNTGSPTGKTYHTTYVPNGIKAHDLWLEMYGEEDEAQRFSVERLAAAVEGVEVEESETRPALAEDSVATHAAHPATEAAAAGSPSGSQPAGVAPAVVAVATVPPAQPVAGGGPDDKPVSVTSRTRALAGEMTAWIGGIFATASQHVQSALGLSPEIQRILIYAVIALGVLWFAGKVIAQWQIRRIASDPTKVNVS
jgi:hypothetical protein